MLSFDNTRIVANYIRKITVEYNLWSLIFNMVFLFFKFTYARSISEMQTTSKTDVFAFGVVLAELITGQQALARDKQEPNKLKTLVSVVSPRRMIRSFLKFLVYYKHVII